MDIEFAMMYAYVNAEHSPDPSSQNGAVLISKSGDDYPIITSACNEIHKAIPAEYQDRAKKYERVTHAEAGAIYLAAKWGMRVEGATLVCPWAACKRCAIAIIEAGISTLVVHKQRMELSSSWDAQIQESMDWMKSAGIEIISLDASFPECKPILVSGKLWQP